MTNYDAAVERLLRIDEVSSLLAMSPSGVRAAVARGDIKAVRIGRRLGIPKSEVDRLIASAS